MIEIENGKCPFCEDQFILNQMDLYECPKCKIQISIASFPFAAVLKEKGSGSFKDNCIRLKANLILSRIRKETKFLLADESVFENNKELSEYFI